MNRTFKAIAALMLMMVFAASCNKPDENRVRYQLSYDDSHQAIGVEMRYIPADEDSVVFVFGNPGFGNQQDIFNCFRDFSASTEYSIDSANRTVTLFIDDRKPVEMHYVVVDDGADGKFVRELFRPVLKKNYLYAPSVCLLLLPQDTNLTASLRWADDTVFKVFSYVNPKLKAGEWWCGTTDDLMMTLFIGGDNVEVDNCKLGTADGYVILDLPDIIRFNSLEIKDFFSKYFTTIRNSWADTAWEEYSLAVLPFIDSQIDHSIGGIGYQKGFCAKYAQAGVDTILDEEKMFVVAHEIGHHWIGGLVSMEIENQWFIEGFNDYQTYVNLMRSGLMSADWFERKFNHELEVYYTSPLSTLSNDEVWKNYWTLGDYNRLPYRRGCIFAFFLDNQIRLATEYRCNMIDLLLALKQKALEKEGQAMSVEEFIQALSLFLDETEARGYIEEYIMQGKLIDFSAFATSKEFGITVDEAIPVVKILETP